MKKKNLLGIVGIMMVHATQSQSLQLMSRAFGPNEHIPIKYTCESENVSPHLSWKNAPENTKSFALICEDPDAPRAEPFVHWVIFNIPPAEDHLRERVGIQGGTSADTVGYYGPCPPAGKPHRYIFTLYALDTILPLQEGATKEELLAAMKNHILEQASLIGLYQRKK